MSTQALLIEIGVEEIPAGVSSSLMASLRQELNKLLAAHGIDQAQLTEGCTPRRLLLHWAGCPLKQADCDETIWGPPEKVAYKDGNPSPAAEGFARKAGLSASDFKLADKGDGKGLYMQAVVHRQGRSVVEILAEAMPGILRKLPSPKQMKWNDGEARDDAFIRPVRWIVARLGETQIPFSFAGVESGKQSRGHRIHGGVGELNINNPLGWLREQKVEADRAARQASIRQGMAEQAMAAGLQVVVDDELISEVADLTEWPVPVLCTFPEDYLRLPQEVIRITLKNHQRCFVTQDQSGKLSNRFFAVANIESKDPAKVAEGNARVVNARLADAAFYFDRDPQQSLEARVERLNGIVFQDGLGMVGDQVRRMRAFVLDVASAVGADANAAQRAAYLCKSDLTAGLVSEFPELQGYMGGVYGRMNGEPEAVCAAIAEHYQPAGADDALPASAEARVIALAERADKLLGYFHLGRIPTASADPFALRRAAIGLIRLLTAADMPVQMSLSEVIGGAARQWNEQRVTVSISAQTQQQVKEFIVERLLGMAASLGAGRNALEAALGASVELPLYQLMDVARLLDGFAGSETGQAVAAANKRIANILKKVEGEIGAVETSLLTEVAEQQLFAALTKAEADFPAEAAAQLQVLAALREPVDTFFDDVMVMAEDAAVRANRLALLSRLRSLFLQLADISRI